MSIKFVAESYSRCGWTVINTAFAGTAVHLIAQINTRLHLVHVLECRPTDEPEMNEDDNFSLQAAAESLNALAMMAIVYMDEGRKKRVVIKDAKDKSYAVIAAPSRLY